MAEIEFSVLSCSCLRQRIPDQEALGREVQALVRERNAAQSIINWRFNTQNARTKLDLFVKTPRPPGAMGG